MEESDLNDDELEIHEADIMCFYDQINYNLVNYDYTYNEKISSEDNCEFNSRLSNVNLEIDASWAEANQVLLSSRVSLSPVILVDDILELADENDEYEDYVPNRGLGLPLRELNIQLGYISIFYIKIALIYNLKYLLTKRYK